jgi:hypothetical protein
MGMLTKLCSYRAILRIVVPFFVASVNADCLFLINNQTGNQWTTSSYKKMLDVSLHIVNDLIFIQNNTMLIHEHMMLNDAIAGRITRLSDNVDALCNDCAHGTSLLVADVEDVLYIIDEIVHLCNNCLPQESYILARKLLHAVHDKLRELIAIPTPTLQY